MKTNRTKFFSLFLVLALLLSATPVMAAEGDRTIPVTLTVEEPIFSVTLPTSLPITLTEDGRVLTADNVTIENHSAGPIAITDIQIKGTNGWETVSFGSLDLEKVKVNTKQVAFKLIFGDETTGSIVNTIGKDSNDFSGNIHIPKGENLALFYDAELPAQTTIIESSELAEVIITVGWYE